MHADPINDPGLILKIWGLVVVVTLLQEMGCLDDPRQTSTYLNNPFASVDKYDSNLTCLRLILTNSAIMTRCTTLVKISVHNTRRCFLSPARDLLRLRLFRYSQNILAGADILLSHHNSLEISVQGVTVQFSTRGPCTLVASDTNRAHHRNISRLKSVLLIGMIEEGCSMHSWKPTNGAAFPIMVVAPAAVG
jgi:hypothetical protein